MKARKVTKSNRREFMGSTDWPNGDVPVIRHLPRVERTLVADPAGAACLKIAPEESEYYLGVQSLPHGGAEGEWTQKEAIAFLNSLPETFDPEKAGWDQL